ncbi:MAG: TlyA family RNA methyltransferase [Nitrospirae bacterium]|nr:MAG: TlyA family RNA methyltransferase [Nitrospirota bacterium]
MTKKERIDKLLLQRGFTDSRNRARALILEGKVFVDSRKIDKVGTLVPFNAHIDVEEGVSYVSRGGLKLQEALDRFDIDVRGFIAMDVGASTGGFTDCLLRRGIEKVYAVDVGYGQLDWKLRNDPRVVLLERTNIRYIDSSLIKEPIDMIVIDVSFISLTKVLPVIKNFLKKDGKVLALIKPQFELKKEWVGKGGIVRDSTKRDYAVEKIKSFAEEIGFSVVATTESPIRGAKGNVEFFIYLVLK